MRNEFMVIQGITSEAYRDSKDSHSYFKERFGNDGFTLLPHFLAERSLTLLRAESDRLLGRMHRRDFYMAGYETPRFLSVLGGQDLIVRSNILWAIYTSYEVRSIVQCITADEIRSCQHPDEFMVLNVLHKSGDTHGWHLDDPPYALVIFIEAPPIGCGGLLEFVTRRNDSIDQPPLRNTLSTGKMQDAIKQLEHNELELKQVHCNPGDAYLLRADLLFHRVTPLEDDRYQRVALNFAFESAEAPEYGKTAGQLYSTSAQKDPITHQRTSAREKDNE